MLFGKRKQKKLGLSLRGGGYRGAAQAGVLQAIDEAGIKIDYLLGASTGAVGATMYAAGIKPFKIAEFYRNFRTFSPWSKNALKERTLADRAQWIETAKEAVGEKTFSDTKIPVWVQATNIDTGQVEYLHRGKLAEAMVASANLPWLFSPFVWGKKRYIDGEIDPEFGADFLRNQGADIAVGALCKPKDRKSFFKLLTPLFIAMNNAYEMDLQLHPMDLLIVSESDASIFDRHKVDELFELGYNAGLKQMPTLRKLLGLE